jgi:hypothetical protein
MRETFIVSILPEVGIEPAAVGPRANRSTTDVLQKPSQLPPQEQGIVNSNGIA